LVRCTDKKDGLQRLLENLKKLKLDIGLNLSGRIKILKGDLAKTKFRINS